MKTNVEVGEVWQRKRCGFEFSIAEGEALSAIRNLTNQISVMNKELNLTNTVLKTIMRALMIIKINLISSKEKKNYYRKKFKKHQRHLKKQNQFMGTTPMKFKNGKKDYMMQKRNNKK